MPVSESSRAATVWGWAKLVLGVLAYGFVALQVISEWDRVSDRLGDASVPWLVAALVAGTAGMVVIAVGWAYLLDAMGHRRPTVRVASWYFVGEIWKYLPGGVWPILGRGEIARQHGVPRVVSYTSVLLSLALLYMAAMVVAAVLLPVALVAGDVPTVALPILAVLPVSLAVLHPRLVGWAAVQLKRIRPQIELPVLSYRQMLWAMVQYAPAWVLIGAVTALAAQAIVPGQSGWPQIVFASLLSWVGGFLVFFLPAGAGVREAIFIAGSGLDSDAAITVAVVSRLVFIAADVIGAVVGRVLEHRAPAASASLSDSGR